ncbi:hypothetical protein QE152_g21681 [Popillia japonica]|uniref:Transposable element P transposase-like RNase H C-terminal domain-containing protein n=1 Tax=Popillia japonica TaxID=7064 RepID=A0AAW1KND5_POPJA
MLPATNWRDTSNFILMINDWFDVHNSTSKFCGNNPTKNAFGIDLDNQEKILDNISSTMEQMIVGKHKSLISFQKGIILSNRSLKELYKHCNKEYGVEYLLTRRLNQDVLENFFSYIRGMGGSDDHPHPLDFRHRLRWYLLGKHATTVFTNNTNTKDTNEQCLLSSLETVDTNNTNTKDTNEQCLLSSLETVDAEDGAECGNDTCLTESLMRNLGTLTQFEAQQKIDDEALIYIAGYVAFKFKHKYNLATQFEAQQKINDEALIYIAGYVAFKFKHKYNLGEPWKNLTIPHKYEWLSYICRRGLMIPNNDVVKVMKIMEQVFYEITYLINFLFKTLPAF